MGKAFSDIEREAVRNRLIEVGEDCFNRYGLQKASVEEITENAGIGRGTFYRFFPSKEDLYLTCIEFVSRRVQESLLNEIRSSAAHPEDTFREYLRRLFLLADENPLLGVLFTRKDEIDSLLKGLPSGRAEAFLAENNLVIEEILNGFRTIGIPIPVSSEMFFAMVRGINLMSLYRDVINAEDFRNMIEIIAGAVADRFLKPESGASV